MAYFYYQKNPFGRWAPCMSADQPNIRTADGTRRKITQVIKIPAEQGHLSFDALCEVYPAPIEET